MNTALVVGSGPAGLMAAEVLSGNGVDTTVVDAMPSFGRKFLMAGKSGLNITKDEPPSEMLCNYIDAPDAMTGIIEAFDAHAVQDWATGLGQEIFTGSSGRVFPKSMKASPLLRAWLHRLDRQGVAMRTRMRWNGWDGSKSVLDTPVGPERIETGVTILALGGASWARLGSDGNWQHAFNRDGLKIAPFSPSNAALSIPWTDHMKPHFGAPLKAVEWRSGDLISRGEATLSSNGLEGGGIYTLTPALRAGEPLFVDLVPGRSAYELNNQLAGKPDKQRLSHWLRNILRLPPSKVALFFEMTTGGILDRKDWVGTVKHLHIRDVQIRPIDEAISTAGGVRFGDMTEDLMLKARRGVFCAGEMLDWEAPTGGYLITACLATGRWAAQGALRYLDAAA